MDGEGHCGGCCAAIPLIVSKGNSDCSIERLVPQIDREHRVALVDRIQSSSRWDFDFFVLMALSTTIAAVGLIQNSSAVVIGAMLVAPLMTPLLGLGLALVQGNPVLATEEQQTQAIRAFETALDLDPAAHSVHYNLGLIFVDRKEHDLALAAFRRAIQLNPFDRDARAWLRKLTESADSQAE